MAPDGNDTKDLRTMFADDPEAADLEVFGRKVHADRRGFLRGAGLAAMSAAVGMTIPFHRNIPQGFIPAAMAQENGLMGKDGLTLLNDRPLNAETPPELLDDAITPTSRHFIRNNGIEPEDTSAENWTLTVDGFVDNPTEMSIADLRDQFEVHTMALTLECGGNGRAFFDPPASGNQWTYGAVACSEWTGVRLKDVLEKAGVQSNVIYTAHYGADTHLSGDASKLPISRGVPIDKAMTDNILIAFEMNGETLHPSNGAPLRLVVPGWPGSCSQKWLKRIQLRDVVHDGPKMTGTSYRVPGYPVAPGDEVPSDDIEIIERMPVKSLVTFPANGASVGMAAFCWIPVCPVRCAKNSDLERLLLTLLSSGRTIFPSTIRIPAGLESSSSSSIALPSVLLFVGTEEAVDTGEGQAEGRLEELADRVGS